MCYGSDLIRNRSDIIRIGHVIIGIGPVIIGIGPVLLRLIANHNFQRALIWDTGPTKCALGPT